MKFIDFDASACDACFKCLRVCPTKAIAFTRERRHIIVDRCIKCGHCQQICPQNALKIHSDVATVKDMIDRGEKVVASLAPSFAASFHVDDPLKIVTALKSLGFHAVEETGAGAEAVSGAYAKYLETSGDLPVITTCCPSANDLVEAYYPGHLNKMLKIISPMVAHGRQIKKREGSHARVVFIGPCLAKKAEGRDFPEAIDAVITFNELAGWLEKERIAMDRLMPTSPDTTAGCHGRAYPMGSLRQVAHDAGYDYLKVDGHEDCVAFLKTLDRVPFGSTMIELNICRGSCLNGPDYANAGIGFFERRQRMKRFIERCAEAPKEVAEPSVVDLSRTFHRRQATQLTPSYGEKLLILRSIGKVDVSDQLNCGACGYGTCLEKAEAVWHGYSEIEMCMPYLREKAESMQNVIFEHTPNLICILDEALTIREVNPAFDERFGGKIPLKGLPVDMILSDPIFRRAFDEKRNILGVKRRWEDDESVFFISLVYLEEESAVVAILTDITANEKHKEELEAVKSQTLTVCREVIDKQMRVAQEIASLLGETTAETKINLERLRKVVLDEEGI